jgi:hypothetical protein
MAVRVYLLGAVRLLAPSAFGRWWPCLWRSVSAPSPAPSPAPPSLTHHLIEHLSWHGAAETVAMLVAVCGVWAFTSFEVTLLDIKRKHQGDHGPGDGVSVCS